MVVTRIPLPIDAHLPAIVSSLQQSSALILRAPPGAGKTTRVPPALLDAAIANGQIWVLQPRRVAARTTAARMADERGCRLGDEIGYQIRFERRFSPRTRLLVMTEGVLTRRLLDDPFLESVGVVVLDEFHERHLETDLALAMVRRVQQTVRPDLKLVVMSATIATEALVNFLAPREAEGLQPLGFNVPVIECDVRTHPVEIEHLAASDDRPLPVQTAAAVRGTLAPSNGDILVFLPGVREIQKTAGLLAGIDALVLPLYGDLPPDQQDRVFQPSHQRKVILATNVAETSITIPGVMTVIDSGWARVPELDANTGLNRLMLKPISQAAAAQRAGRAGRTGPGRCLRLWTAASQRARREFDTPEIHRVDLAGIVLQLRCWGEADVRNFPWFDPPRPEALDRAETLLRALDAVDDDGVTALGRQMVQLPVHPRLARLLLEAAQLGHAFEAAYAAALLSERDPFIRAGRKPTSSSPSDVLDRVEALQEFYRTGRTEFPTGRLHAGGAQRIRQAAEQLQRVVDASKPRGCNPSASLEGALGRALLAGFPDRLARRREPRSRKALMVGGRGVKLAEESAVTEPELVVAVDVDGVGEDALVRMASGVEREWLPATHVSTGVDVEFDSNTGRIQARRRTRWFDLVLDETPAELPEDQSVATALAEAARDNWCQVAPPHGDEATANLLFRVRCLREWMPELGLPAWDEAELQALLPQVCVGRRSLDDIRRARWYEFLQGTLSAQQMAAINREAPERLQVPSGSRVALKYEPGRPPVLAVRIQEVFGWSDTPRIAGGRVPVLLHLLAPNNRPQQITDDLRSFWNTAYQQVRGELRRRYPKHAWPEDPWTATAERRPKR
jgi:ATP-dependent helicase HrpB